VGEARQLADWKRRQLCASIDTESLGWTVTQCNWSFPSFGALPVCAHTPPPAIQKLESNKTGEKPHSARAASTSYNSATLNIGAHGESAACSHPRPRSAYERRQYHAHHHYRITTF
jgi:hypothetical protein